MRPRRFWAFPLGDLPKKPFSFRPPILGIHHRCPLLSKNGVGWRWGAERKRGAGTKRLFSSLLTSFVASGFGHLQHPISHKSDGDAFLSFCFSFFAPFPFFRAQNSADTKFTLSRECKGGEDTTFRQFQVLCAEESYCEKAGSGKAALQKKISERSGGEMPMEILPHILAGKKEMGKALSGTQRIFFQRHAIKRKGGRRIQKIFQPQAKRASINFIMGSLKVAGRRKRPEDQFLFHFGAKSHLMHFVPPSLHCRRRLGGQTENIDFVIRNLYPPFLCFLSYISFPPPLLSFRREKVSLDFSAVWDPEGGKLRSRKEEEEEDRPTDRPSSLPFSSLGRHIRNILERDSPMTRNALYPYMPLANPLCKSFLFEQLLPHVVAELGVHIYW